MAAADHVMTDGAEGRVQCTCGEVSSRKGTEALRREWRTNHRRKVREAEAARVPCTASGQVRTSFTNKEWITSAAVCPDCGDTVELIVRGPDLPGRAKIRAHRAPVGVTPVPHAYLSPAAPEPPPAPAAAWEHHRQNRWTVTVDLTTDRHADRRTAEAIFRLHAESLHRALDAAGFPNDLTIDTTAARS